MLGEITMKVKTLDAHLINVIAAGEVIDRPASIVKELVENALDAKARQIEVETQGGGVRLIRVSDDGEGMTREDLKLCVLRHTTSKIASSADLETIQTLGFRGEALASVCEVARVQLSSRTAADPEGHVLIVAGGNARPLQATGRASGTTLEVRDLFFNLPVRRKFLKSEKTENLHITRTMKRFLFSHPHVHLRLIQGKRTALDSPGSNDLLEIAAHLYGTKIAKGLVPLEFQGEMLHVRGWISTAQLTRGDRNEQYTFINGRAVSDAVVQYAINRAYEGTLDRGKSPYICLQIELDPRLLDVNVHPQKHEVRFLDSQPVRRDIMQALSQTLVSQHATPQLPWKAVEQALRYRPEQPATDVEKLDLHKELEQRRQAPEMMPPADPASGSRFKPQPAPPSATLTSLEEVRVVGQIHGTYIVVQTPQGFELIDQHVAHERVLYEKFLQQLSEDGVRAQKLLLPESLKFPADQAQFLQEHLETFLKLGIEVEAFGAETFLIRGWPQALAEFHAEVGYRLSLEQLLALLEQEGEPNFESLAQVLVASLSCEAAVVKNRLLPLEVMRHLVDELKQTSDPFHCPHGRPIILKYELPQLERAFKRR